MQYQKKPNLDPKPRQNTSTNKTQGRIGPLAPTEKDTKETEDIQNDYWRSLFAQPSFEKEGQTPNPLIPPSKKEANIHDPWPNLFHQKTNKEKTHTPPAKQAEALPRAKAMEDGKAGKTAAIPESENALLLDSMNETPYPDLNHDLMTQHACENDATTVVNPWGVEFMLNNILDSTQINKIKAEAEKPKADKDPIKSVLATVMRGMSRFLGRTKGSKLSGNLTVNIPISNPKVAVSLGLEAEQEKKDDKPSSTEDAHIGVKFSATAGITLDISKEISGKADLNVFLGAESTNRDTTAQLLSYGFYKAGRVTGDILNDWETVVVNPSGLTSSAAIYYGLNYIYGDKNKSVLDRAMDSSDAEESIEDIENKLFAEDANADKNEVTFGGGLKAELEAGDKNNNIKGAIEATRTSKINQDSIKNSQKDAKKDIGFLSDYKTGSHEEFEMKLSGALKVGKVSGSRDFTWLFGKEDNNDSEQSDKKNSSWKFKQFDFQTAYAIENISKLKLTQKELIQQLVQAATETYGKEKDLAKKKDSLADLQPLNSTAASNELYNQIKASQKQEEIQDNKQHWLDALVQTGSARAMDGITKNTDLVDVDDTIEVQMKISAENKSTPKITFQIVRITKTKVDLEVVEATVVDSTPLGIWTYTP
ncbi:hypothetical protein N7E81_10100 [Reichenbachiella carrageenanivorans]|uniref:Uncharacterized protein n=1 Tax=Reichenbachiella carrageenanivorans TaxID=2979869 RepID=A0ABY6D1I2_9BACT|nr:hypothetical protein [Reichenbachiella carrageenanivorans]UXX77720.1 hypothetical protein N7E81_10100 [Reichenbachiella carrageenanivorans]